MRRNMSEEEKQKRIKVREFLKQNPIFNPGNLNTFFKDMMKVMIEEFSKVSNVPCDRNSEYEPQVIKKHQNTIEGRI